LEECGSRLWFVSVSSSAILGLLGKELILRLSFISRLTGAVVLAAFALPMAAQYTDRAAYEELGGVKEFARRRAELGKQCKTGQVLLFARTAEPETSHYREDNDFYYYTGVADPGSAVLIDCATGNAMLLEPEQSKREIQYMGSNVLSLPEEERDKFGFASVGPIMTLDRMLAGMYGSKETDLWLRLGFADAADGARGETGQKYVDEYQNPYGETLPRDREIIKKIRERYPLARLHDITPAIDAMRIIKTPQEIEILRRNGKISAEGQRRAMAKVKPGMFEYEVESEALYWYRKAGAQGVAYTAIVGSGANGNAWHYSSNRKKMGSNEVVVFDYAADLNQLTMDITRTFSTSGKFTPEQAKWYRVDLAVQKAIIAMLNPGNTYEQALEAGMKILRDAKVEEAGGQIFPGFPGHYVGMAVHDVGGPLRGPIKAGHVVTVEPIIEFPKQQMHFRVEDTVLVTENGPEILTGGVPKEMAEVERLVGSEAK
jgi:Xaa-Pro aminopeptidase